MAFLGRAEEVIVADFQPLPQALERRYDLIYIFDRGNAQFFRFALDLLAVFIAAGQEKYLFPPGTVKTGNSIRYGRAIRMPDVQLFTGIINGCGNKKRFLVHDPVLLSLNKMALLSSNTSLPTYNSIFHFFILPQIGFLLKSQQLII